MSEKVGGEPTQNTLNSAPRSQKRSDVDARRLSCPVRDCDYSHESVHGIMGHVGNGHEDGWDETDAEPREVHIEATRRDADAMRRVMKVEDLLAREGLSPPSYAVYEHQGYETLRVEPDEWLGDEFQKYHETMRGIDTATFYGDGYWLTDEFVDDLPDSTEPDGAGDGNAGSRGIWWRCDAPDCQREAKPLTNTDGTTVNACRKHRKDVFGVTS